MVVYRDKIIRLSWYSLQLCPLPKNRLVATWNRENATTFLIIGFLVCCSCSPLIHLKSLILILDAPLHIFWEKELRGFQNFNMLFTSCPKARDGHRFPGPSEPFVRGSLLSEQGSGPKEGQCSAEHRENLYIHLWLCMHVHLRRFYSYFKAWYGWR